MKKYGNYFPHFSNARTDRKIINLVRKYGWAGYAYYFVILEVLREQPDFKLPIAEIGSISWELRVEREIVHDIVANSGLFQIEDNIFFSPRFNNLVQPLIERSNRARAAIKKRWQNTKEDTNVSTKEYTNEDTKKRKEKKRNIYTQRASEINEKSKILFAKALEAYGYCQKVTPARDLWESLPAYEQQKIMEHIPLYIKNHEENNKRNFLPDFYTYLNEERYNAPTLPYSKPDLKPGEVDKSDWKMWDDGYLRPPDVKRNERGVYYHVGNMQPYIVLPKNPYK
jgi:hypothetical protein